MFCSFLLVQLVDLTCQLLLHAAAPFVEDDSLFRMITSLSHPTATLGTSTSGSGLERSTSGAPLKDGLSNLEKFSLDTQNFQVRHAGQHVQLHQSLLISLWRL